MFLYFGGGSGLIVDNLTATEGGTTVVPEPAAYTLLAGAASLVALVMRRPRKNLRQSI